MRTALSLEVSFWPKVQKGSEDECWIWTAAKNDHGYGRLGQLYAHRISYELHVGPIPDGAVIDHKCHQPACVNPKHLQPVTHKQNCENLASRRNNRSGVRGVHWNRNAKKWQGIVRHNNKPLHVGYFADLDAAEAAVVAKRNELFTNNLADRVAS